MNATIILAERECRIISSSWRLPLSVGQSGYIAAPPGPLSTALLTST